MAKKDRTIANDQIRADELRVIDGEGEQLGIMTRDQALDRAFEANLDLVLVSPNAKPPVARIMDLGKYRYEQQKKAKEQRKNQKQQETKEIRMSPTIDTHDLETKLRQATSFIEDGNKVKVSVRFRGRAITHKDLGRDVLDQFAEGMSEVASVTTKPQMEGRNMMMMLEPKKD